MKKKLIIIISILFVIVALVLIIILSPYKINIIGDKTVTINYKENYIEKGAYITKLGIKLKKEIEINNNININELGEYIVTYKYKDVKVVRNVIVDDIEKPNINLKNGDITIFVNEDYIEEGATANDNLDGDLSKKITIDKEELDTSKKGDYKIKYSVCDSHENCSELFRNVAVKEGDIFYGKFKQKTELQSSILTLRGSNKTFKLDINFCEGFYTLEGTYTVKKNKISLNFNYKKYKNLVDKGDSKFIFTIANEDNVKYQSHDLGCGPFNADIYERIK